MLKVTYIMKCFAAEGEIYNDLVCRPPGHHAMTEEYSGYCYFNNVAVAARVALEKHGLKRSAVFYWSRSF